VIGTFAAASRLPLPERDNATLTGQAEGRAVLALLRRLGDRDWQRPTDSGDWDVRTLISHLVGHCEDSLRLRTMLRRELAGKRRYPDKSSVDAHNEVQVHDHRADSGPELVERFGLLWPRAVKARGRRPTALRRMTVSSGDTTIPRFNLGYLLDVLYDRELWMHRLDLAWATGQPFTISDHDRLIVEQVVRDLALAWRDVPLALDLTGTAGGMWTIGAGEPVACVRADAVTFMRTMAGRDHDPELQLVDGDASALALIRQARVFF
jgi:uncharacterized protein (TIGR03083 family)